MCSMPHGEKMFSLELSRKSEGSESLSQDMPWREIRRPGRSSSSPDSGQTDLEASGEPARLIGAEMEESHCFGCSPRNLHGLRLTMSKIQNGLSSEFTLGEDFESYPGRIHGGIISTIL